MSFQSRSQLRQTSFQSRSGSFIGFNCTFETRITLVLKIMKFFFLVHFAGTYYCMTLFLEAVLFNLKCKNRPKNFGWISSNIQIPVFLIFSCCTCTLSILFPVICIVLVIAAIVGAAVYYGYYDTDKDASTNFNNAVGSITGTGKEWAQTIKYN